MKLGICYMVFDGEEFLEFTTKNIRNNIDHIAVTYQTTSYFGNPCDPDLPALLDRLKHSGLIDEIIHYDTDLTIHHKENELNLRNTGLAASKNAGCTHHISADVDEFYIPQQLEYVKKIMEDDYDLSLVHNTVYYKDPTFLVVPEQNPQVSLIHPINNKYNKDIKFPKHIEPTRRLVNHQKCKIFTKEEFLIHHMSYVRKDIRKKFANSDNAQFYKLEKFMETYDNYQLGGRVCLLPDYLNRKTIQVENQFGIKF